MKTKKEQKRRRISSRVVFLLSMLGLFIVIATSAIGYYQFTQIVKQLYYEKTYQIAHDLKDEIDIKALEEAFPELEKAIKQDNLKPVSKQIENTTSFKNIKEEMDNALESFDCTAVEIFRIDDSLKQNYINNINKTDKPLTEKEIKEINSDSSHVAVLYYSVFDKETFGEEDEESFPGQMINFLDDKKDELNQQIEELESSNDSDVHINDTTYYEYLGIEAMSTMEAIKNDSNQIVGIINVEVPMILLFNARNNFIKLVIIYSIIIITLFILIYLYFSRRFLIKPLETITKETENFVKNNNETSQALKEIKTNDEIETLAKSILKLEEDINNYIENLKTVTTERERMQAELDLASGIQASMLPQNFPAFPDRNEFNIMATMTPAKEVGGDFYDFFLIDDDHLALVIGDVSGKGVPAALFMANAKVLINATASSSLEADKIFNKVNSYLVNNNGGNLFITSWFGIYEISSGKLDYVTAGHEAPVLFHKNGSFEELKVKANLALAIFDGIDYRLHQTKLTPGDKLFLVTDGVTEAQTKDIELFTKFRLIESIKKVFNKPIETIIKSVRNDIDAFVNGAEQFDDITIVGFEVNDLTEEKDFKE